MASDSGLSEPGEDWDELDKRAMEEDRKQAMNGRAGAPARGGNPQGAKARRGAAAPPQRRR